MPDQPQPLDGDGYRILAEFRYRLRFFLQFSEDAANRVGLTSQQHQSLLFLKSRQPDPVSVGELARWLLIKPHSAAALAQRCDESGLIRRIEDPDDRRRTLLHLTESGEASLASLTSAHLEEYGRIGDSLGQLLSLIQDPGSVPNRV